MSESLRHSIGRSTTDARCAVCKQGVGRDRHGRMLLHTRTDYNGWKPMPVICEGSDKGARP